jgi:hypothetical protein
LVEAGVQRRLLAEKEIHTLKAIIDELAPKLNAYLRSIGNVPVRTENN